MSQQSKRRVAQLLRQYPFLQDINHQADLLARLYECELGTIIKVKRGDANLMFRQASDVLGTDGCFIVKHGEDSTHGTRFEYYRPVNREGELGKPRNWRGEDKEHYVRDLFRHPCYDWSDATLGGQDPFDTIRDIVWVIEEAWYPESVEPDEIASAKAIHKNLWITIYKEPKKGWRELYQNADPMTNVDLYGWRLLDGPNIRDSFREVIYDRLNRLGLEFQQKVWSTGFGKIVDDSRARGMSGQYGDVKVLTYIIAGRLRVQFERGGTMFNLGGLDEVDDPRLGFGSIEAKLPQAEKMVRDVVKFWENADEATRQSVHQDDPNVGLGF